MQIDLLKVYIYSNYKHNSFELIKGLEDVFGVNGNEDILNFEITGLLEEIKQKVLAIVKENTKLKAAL